MCDFLLNCSKCCGVALDLGILPLFAGSTLLLALLFAITREIIAKSNASYSPAVATGGCILLLAELSWTCFPELIIVIGL